MSVHKHGTTGPGCAGTCCLKATDLGVSFGGEEVLRDVSFHLHCGEIVALIGPNGAGKSSLFRTILGQVPHTGTIEFQRAGGDKTRPLIGYVPQSPSFDRGDPVSVFDFFSAAISRYPVFLPSPRSLRARVGACLARVHGESLLDRRIGALSGGELQRVLLALALEPLPHILVLDEPAAGLDPDGILCGDGVGDLLHKADPQLNIGLLERAVGRGEGGIDLRLDGAGLADESGQLL